MSGQTTNAELKEYLEQEGISHDDIINNEIEQEHSLTDEEKAKLAAEAEKVELAEGETIDEGISDEETLFQAIQTSRIEKKEQFAKEMKANPNKRLYSSKIVIEYTELIEVDKNSLRYEENEEDRKFNDKLMSSKTTDFELDALKFAATIQNTQNATIEQVHYMGKPYQKKCNCVPGIEIKTIGLENAPKTIQNLVKGLQETFSNNSCSDCENCEA